MLRNEQKGNKIDSGSQVCITGLNTCFYSLKVIFFINVRLSNGRLDTGDDYPVEGQVVTPVLINLFIGRNNHILSPYCIGGYHT
ncbi:hypothetical protein SAMN05216244_1601 [Sediminibacillus halophilus]|uniref:Uncharacterized protein n=1 Tax=Sediminibacillus halophilus TaxID=482461 RepID=A0A1G9QPW7_9BACI|nr:hypothetical protein SAMN05216244_1601 [Sediminibacillus halophilus]